MIWQTLGIRGAIAAALGIACLALLAINGSLRGKLEDSRNDLAAERAGHALTRGSVETLEGQIRFMMQRAREREADYNARQDLAADLGNQNERLARETDRTIRRLEQLATGEGDGRCLVSTELQILAEGL